jgi:hypothetical protein
VLCDQQVWIYDMDIYILYLYLYWEWGWRDSQGLAGRGAGAAGGGWRGLAGALEGEIDTDIPTGYGYASERRLAARARRPSG